MATKTLLTIGQFDQLPEPEDVIYELDEGELITMARPRPRHNLVRESAARHIGVFVQNRHLGRVLVETEFALSEDTVRIPDVAFLTSEQMSRIDLDHLHWRLRLFLRTTRQRTWRGESISILLRGRRRFGSFTQGRARSMFFAPPA